MGEKKKEKKKKKKDILIKAHHGILKVFTEYFTHNIV